MRIAICEDEKIYSDHLRKLIGQWAEKGARTVHVDVFPSAEAFLAIWADETTYDLLFLDIKMRRMDGTELAELIRRHDQSMVIIFVTGMIEYVLLGYKVKALRYLIKPIKHEDCFEALDSAAHEVALRREHTFVVTVETQNVRMPYSEVYYFEIMGHYITAHTHTGQYKFKKGIGELESELPIPQFCRCHRSFIANMQHVQRINKDGVLLSTQQTLPISRSHWAAFNEVFLQFYARSGV